MASCFATRELFFPGCFFWKANAALKTRRKMILNIDRMRKKCTSFPSHPSVISFSIVFWLQWSINTCPSPEASIFLNESWGFHFHQIQFSFVSFRRCDFVSSACSFGLLVSGAFNSVLSWPHRGHHRTRPGSLPPLFHWRLFQKFSYNAELLLCDYYRLKQ